MSDELRQTAEAWAKQKKTPAHLLAAMGHHAHWVQGALLTETEYDKARDDFLKEPIR